MESAFFDFSSLDCELRPLAKSIGLKIGTPKCEHLINSPGNKPYIQMKLGSPRKCRLSCVLRPSIVGNPVSQQGACVLRCLWRFRTIRKTRHRNFRACTLQILLFWLLLYRSSFLLGGFGSPSRVHVCCAACGASEPSEKAPPLIFAAFTVVFHYLLECFWTFIFVC